MNIDENMLCPVCKAKLFTDEVAFCPECGAPHHKECYLGLGHCAFADKHGTSEQWQPPKIEPPKATEKAQETQSESSVENTANNPQFQGYAGNYRKKQENPFFAANGIDKDENIDGESAEDIAKFVGYNALRYINVFKKMSALKRRINWNWVAFLLPEYWLISRKCYFQAILLSLYSALISVFSTLGMSNVDVKNLMSSGVVTQEAARIVGILFICSCVTLIINLFMGMFGDYIYKKKVYSTIKEMKQEGRTSEIDYIQKGGVNLMLPVILYFGINILALVMMNFV